MPCSTAHYAGRNVRFGFWHIERDPRAFFLDRINYESQRMGIWIVSYRVSRGVVLHHSLRTFLSSWQRPGKSMFRNARRCMKRETAHQSIAIIFSWFRADSCSVCSFCSVGASTRALNTLGADSVTNIWAKNDIEVPYSPPENEQTHDFVQMPAGFASVKWVWSQA